MNPCKLLAVWVVDKQHFSNTSVKVCLFVCVLERFVVVDLFFAFWWGRGRDKRRVVKMS